MSDTLFTDRDRAYVLMALSTLPPSKVFGAAGRQHIDFTTTVTMALAIGEYAIQSDVIRIEIANLGVPSTDALKTEMVRIHECMRPYWEAVDDSVWVSLLVGCLPYLLPLKDEVVIEGKTVPATELLKKFPGYEEGTE